MRKAAFRVEGLTWPETKNMAYSKSKDKAMYRCPYCFFADKNLIAMKRHMAAHHVVLAAEGVPDTNTMWRTFVQFNQE